MKHIIFVGALAVVLASAPAWAQANKEDKSSEAGAHTAPRPQPNTAQTPTVPTGELALGTCRIPKAVKADGKTLPAGTYQLRVTAQSATQDAKGQTPSLERCVEFMQAGQVKGREVVVIVPQSDTATVMKDTPPKANGPSSSCSRVRLFPPVDQQGRNQSSCISDGVVVAQKATLHVARIRCVREDPEPTEVGFFSNATSRRSSPSPQTAE